MKRLLRILRWLALYLFFLEVFLTLGGKGFIIYQDIQNRKTIGGKDVYKIMCLGDSITAEGGDNAYPIQLEKYLNTKAGTAKFKVINHGIPSADSAMLLGKVRQFIAEDKPDMTVVMMGYNDRAVLQDKGRESWPNQMLRKVKVYRLGRGLLEKFVVHLQELSPRWKLRSPPMDAELLQGANETRPVPQQYGLMLLYAIELANQNEFAKAVVILENLANLDLEKSFMDRVWHELGRSFYALKDYKKLIIVSGRNLSVDPFDIQSTEFIKYICKDKQEENEVMGMLTTLAEKNQQSIPLNGLVAACYADYGHKESAERYFQKVQQLESHGENLVLRENYKKLYTILKENGIQPVFVQYPNRDLKVLKDLFKSTQAEYDDIIFIENESVFQASKDQNRYNEFFIDRAGDNFGHGTVHGNFLLASHMGDSILEYLNIKGEGL